ncbi:hypothetical protein SPRG_16843 [Saprolegnia parasitica CBS 223.65]|uniref:Fatty acid hydroxylase domain-containing protein n=1 Tax=Saprolegnia parasitica (strain CBS 223.65) TaxID=695850 RepID=A0A067BHA7_SAPPC|nr:hypothetical protein SPRG_16843 [Saprolegnia parasitica CBS 223.65]KDO17744.1 hypothetical protein SPRG_16843 [Saprolegnia parasitica CBS 223.65]|eukprot:XP_012211545.1 hypothetical protein SPRG_16843 [Saprolegnia parasitica CBS 223.65]
MLLDGLIVRDGPAPLDKLHGAPYFLLTMFVMQYGHFVLLPHYGFTGFSIYIFLATATLTLDGLVSNSFGKNVVSLRANGFSDATTVATMLLNTVASQFLTFVVVYYMGTPDTVAGLLHPSSYSPWIVAAIAINLALTEGLFFAAHKLLHELWPHVHVMHHCCLHSSHSTNVIFHPIDLAFEFGGPGAVVLAMHIFVWEQNLTVLLATYLIVQTYYAIDHSEWLQTYHYKHHAQLNAVYTIYINHRSSPQLDQVRSLVKKPLKAD